MTDPPDSLDDAALVEAFVQAYADGKHMAKWYVKLDHVKESLERYTPASMPPSIPDAEWLEESDPSET